MKNSGLKDLRLPLLADISLHVSAAEEAMAQESFMTADHEIERADDSLQQLRSQWPEVDASDRGLLGALAKPLADRLESLRRKRPAQRVVVQGEAQAAADQELDSDPYEQ